MSNRLLIGIVDTKANALVAHPQTYTNVIVAIREFNDIINAEQMNPVKKHVEDHELRLFGEFDEDTLQFTARNELIQSGAQWIAQNTQEQS